MDRRSRYWSLKVRDETIKKEIHENEKLASA